MSNQNELTIYNLPLHETLVIAKTDAVNPELHVFIEVMRVHNGWIYTRYHKDKLVAQTFVAEFLHDNDYQIVDSSMRGQ